jgi:hypothetical protein
LGYGKKELRISKQEDIIVARMLYMNSVRKFRIIGTHDCLYENNSREGKQKTSPGGGHEKGFRKREGYSWGNGIMVSGVGTLSGWK